MHHAISCNPSPLIAVVLTSYNLRENNLGCRLPAATTDGAERENSRFELLGKRGETKNSLRKTCQETTRHRAKILTGGVQLAQQAMIVSYYFGKQGRRQWFVDRRKTYRST